jgi:SAM-dependent methyltransferase
MFTESAELYDLIYRSIKDYRAESAAVAARLRELAPSARTILDVACGTGEHARYLTEDAGYVVSGIDIEPRFVEIAQAKVPSGTFWRGDMAAFELEDRFDAVICLFSSIGYLLDAAAVTRALRCFARHLASNGVVLVEPWFTPDVCRPGHVHMKTVESDGLTVVRMGQSGVEGRVSTVDFHYLIGKPDGIEHRTERHELALLTRAEMTDCFARAGYGRIDYDEAGFTGRGLYIARV